MQAPVSIMSEGTRLSADLWLPDGTGPDEKLPAILLCHGWGGLKEHLNQTYARWFSRGGFAVLAFDYRGWGESDARLVPVAAPSEPDSHGDLSVRAHPLRKVVDPYDQIRDITSCLDYLESHPNVDPERIGLWGTSYGGGHVVYMAAHDPRVKAIVAQVSAQSPALIASDRARERAAARARGEASPFPPAEDAVPGLAGIPDLAKMRLYRPLATAQQIRVPLLVIDAEEEELFDRMQNGHAVYEIVRSNAPARYATFPCKHYAVYDEFYRAASNLARDWFTLHLQQR
jgi:hypothetical protein